MRRLFCWRVSFSPVPQSFFILHRDVHFRPINAKKNWFQGKVGENDKFFIVGKIFQQKSQK